MQADTLITVNSVNQAAHTSSLVLYPKSWTEIERQKAEMNSTKRLIVYGLGIFICYFYYGILHEKITRSTYGAGKERFTYTLSLVFIQCVINAIFAKILLLTIMKQGTDPTTWKYYAIESFTYLSAMVSSNMALRHVNYPTQVIGKSCKPIPVMLLGVLVARKQYPLKKYFFVFLIVLGIVIFMYKDEKAASAESKSLGMGEILLLTSLVMDGLTAAMQERMKSDFRTKSGHMMYRTNVWSTLYLGAAIILTAEVVPFVRFVQRYPYVMYNILMFSVMSAVGQMFIYLVVTEFGPLVCSIITTTRKFFTVLASVIFFGNTLSPRQWVGTALVFTGLILDSYYSKRGSVKAA